MAYSRSLRSILLLCIVGFGIPGRADDTPPAATQSSSLLTTAETKDVDAVVRLLVAAGFPDGAHAVVYRGKIHVTATFDATKQAPPLPTEQSGMQESLPNGGGAKYGFDFDGLHFKLPDGTWVISLTYQFKPGKGDAVDTTNAKEVNLSTLTADAAAEAPFDADKSAGSFIAAHAAGDRNRTRAGLNRFVPVTKYLQLNVDDYAPALVLLSRAGWTDAAGMAVAVADTRCRSYWQLKPWTTPDWPFDPTGEYPDSKAEERAWLAAHKQIEVEPPATAIRRAMFRWCRAQLMRLDPEDAMLPHTVAAACCKACLDPNDPQKFGPRIDTLLTATAIPVNRPAGASLPDRLASWETQARMPKMVVTSGDGGKSFSTGFSAPEPAYKPVKGDLDALVALLGDDSPSRFFDSTGDRPVGDNAWRAVTELLKTDPRVLAVYPTDKPWTVDERRAAAKAVQAWWKTNRKDYLDK